MDYVYYISISIQGPVYEGGGGGGAQGTPYFFLEKNAHKQKVQKDNINKIYQTEPRLKEKTCLIPLLKQKRLLAPSNSSINNTESNVSLIAAVRASNLKRSWIMEIYYIAMCFTKKQ